MEPRLPSFEKVAQAGEELATEVPPAVEALEQLTVEAGAEITALEYAAQNGLTPQAMNMVVTREATVELMEMTAGAG